MSDEVLVERRGAVQVIIIDRPEARNALNRTVATAVRDAADELDREDELRAGVLTGAGGTFSSGMDLKAFLRGESPSFPGRGLCGITQTPPRKPLVGAVEGWALALTGPGIMTGRATRRSGRSRDRAPGPSARPAGAPARSWAAHRPSWPAHRPDPGRHDGPNLAGLGYNQEQTGDLRDPGVIA